MWLSRHSLTIVLSALFALLPTAMACGHLYDRLSAGGYTAQDAPSAEAGRLLLERFGQGSPQIVLRADAVSAVSSPSLAQEGTRLTADIAALPGVVRANSFWTLHDPRLISANRRSALIAVTAAGNEQQVGRTADMIAERFSGAHGSFTVSVSGRAAVIRYAEERSRHDLFLAELLGVPLVALVLLLVFRSLAAALLPLAVGVTTVAVTSAVLAGVSRLTDVSVFAVNLTTALGFGLAVDYSLILVGRFREETGKGAPPAVALEQVLRTAGRTVACSGTVVAACLMPGLAFPAYFFRSLAGAGIVVVLVAMTSSLLLLPALLFLLGTHVDWGRIPALPRRGRRPRLSVPALVLRRPLSTTTACVVTLVLAAAPFAGARYGFIDQRWLPRDAAPRAVAEGVHRDFRLADLAMPVIALPDAPEGSPEAAAYVQSLSRTPGVLALAGPGGVYVAGQLSDLFPRLGPPGDQTQGTWLAVITRMDPYSDAAYALVRAIQAKPGPGRVLVDGETARLLDLQNALRPWLTLTLLWICLVCGILLFVFTGSVVIPVKALLMNALSLGASFGSMTFLFQEGHLQWLIRTGEPTGHLDPLLPPLIFCIAFGLSMDYEVFMIATIQEEYTASGDNASAVLAGLRRSARTITGASVIVVIALGAMATSGLTTIKMLGVTLALAVVVDALIVRCLLVPAVMTLAGRWNWWAPPPLRAWHQKRAADTLTSPMPTPATRRCQTQNQPGLGNELA